MTRLRQAHLDEFETTLEEFKSALSAHARKLEAAQILLEPPKPSLEEPFQELLVECATALGKHTRELEAKSKVFCACAIRTLGVHFGAGEVLEEMRGFVAANQGKKLSHPLDTQRVVNQIILRLSPSQLTVGKRDDAAQLWLTLQDRYKSGFAELKTLLDTIRNKGSDLKARGLWAKEAARAADRPEAAESAQTQTQALTDDPEELPSGKGVTTVTAPGTRGSGLSNSRAFTIQLLTASSLKSLG